MRNYAFSITKTEGRSKVDCITMIDHSPTFPPDARFQLYVRLLHKLILDNCSKSEKLCFYQTRVKKRLRLAFIHDLVSSKFTY